MLWEHCVVARFAEDGATFGDIPCPQRARAKPRGSHPSLPDMLALSVVARESVEHTARNYNAHCLALKRSHCLDIVLVVSAMEHL